MPIVLTVLAQTLNKSSAQSLWRRVSQQGFSTAIDKLIFVNDQSPCFLVFCAQARRLLALLQLHSAAAWRMLATRVPVSVLEFKAFPKFFC